MMDDNVLQELLRQYKHFCDDCPKAYDFTCSGADAKKCDAIKQALIYRINEIQNKGTSGDGLFGEREVAYFSHMREFMKSDIAHKVMEAE